jgi:ABC-type phosphate transport system substrate-binding protein
MNPFACLPQRIPKGFHAVLVAGISVTFALAAVGAHADSIKIGGTSTGLGAMKLMAQEFGKSKPDAQLIVTPTLGGTAPSGRSRPAPCP